jgi:hypothetical protein
MVQQEDAAMELKGRKAKWIQSATAKMKKKGTVGKFGKATPKKIAAGKRAGGERKKEAIFAENMRAIARKRKGR